MNEKLRNLSGHGLCVSASYWGDTASRTWTASLHFYAAHEDPGWALDVSFLVNPSCPRPPGDGVVGRWGDPLQFDAKVGPACPRRFFWSWADLAEEYALQQAERRQRRQ